MANCVIDKPHKSIVHLSCSIVSNFKTLKLTMYLIRENIVTSLIKLL